MKSSHRKASQQKRRWQALEGNPVVLAYSKDARDTRQAKASEEFADQLITTRISMLSAQDGEDATELLARLSVVIGTPCEAGARQHGRDQPWVRQLHGALRTIQSMCLDGYL
jgi:hypothetical protein